MQSQLFLTQLLIILAKTTGFISGPMYRTDLTRLHHSLFKLQDTGSPHSFKSVFARDIKHVSTMGPKFLALAGILNAMSGKIQRANAIGEIAELKQQKMVLQDVSFNVLDPEKEADVLSALFQTECKVIRSIENRDQRQVVVAFGADAYRSPPSFHPGISTFLEDGGHATISFISKKFNDDGVIELNEAGNGFKYIKVGAETIRLSKAIEAGAQIKYAYGWVDLETPGQIPLEVVVGTARDPIMCSAIEVSNLKESLVFFKESLGMTELPFPLARKAGSQYEQQQSKDSIYIGYSENSMGILLQSASAANKKVNVGSQLIGFTIIVDDGDDSNIPSAVTTALQGKDENDRKLISPDGYVFKLVPYKSFQKTATSSISV